MIDREAEIRAALLADADVAALVKTRVWFSVLPAEYDLGPWLPAIVVQGQDAEDEYTMGGPIGAARGQIQIDAYADDRPSCEALRSAIRGALGSLHDARITTVGTLTSSPSYDTEAKLWRSVQFFDVWSGA